MNGLGRNNKDKENKSLVFTKETLGVVLILFATLCLVCLITRENIFSAVGLHVNSFLFGCFGFFAYGVLIYAIVMGVLLISGKSTGISAKRKFYITLSFVLIALISHIATIGSGEMTYGEYISESYRMGAGGIATTSAGGFFTALFAFVFSRLLTNVGSYVVLGVLLAVVCYFGIKDFINSTPKQKQSNKVRFRSSFVREGDGELDVDIAGTKEYPVSGVDFSSAGGKQKLFVNNPDDFAVKNKREISKDEKNPSGIKIGFVEGGLGVVNTGATEQPVENDDFKKKLDYIKTPAVIDMEKFNEKTYPTYTAPSYGTTEVSSYVNRYSEEPKQEEKPAEQIPFIEHQQPTPSVSPIANEQDSIAARAEAFGARYANVVEPDDSDFTKEEMEEVFRAVEAETENVEEVKNENSVEINDIPFIDETDEDTESLENDTNFVGRAFTERTRSTVISEESVNEVPVAEEPIIEEEKPAESPIINNGRIRGIFGDTEKEPIKETPPAENLGYTSRVVADNNAGSRRGFGVVEPEQQPVVEEEKPKKPAPPTNREYFRPPLDLLEDFSQPINACEENHQERMEIIQRTLEDFHINAVPQNYVQGPSITRYEIMMPAGIPVKRVLNHDSDLKMRLSAKDGVRIEAPIPGKNLVGIEVANSVKTTVGLKEVMEGMAAKKSKGALNFAIGKDIVGNAISDDLAKGPHFLVAGATGSGKSVCLHVMLVSLIMRYSPEELKLVLVDPKSVEFRKYEHLPHLLVDEIVTEPKRAIALLQWAYEETTRRNDMFTECGGFISNIDDYNSQIASDTIPKLPRIVFVIDELADLMEQCKKDLEARIRMVAAKSRSAGIHLVLATQRPSVDVITGTIKTNLPSRIALKVMNFNDSQTILGGAGAEKLLGYGDMLYKNLSMSDTERYQGAYITPREITNVVNYIKEHNTAYFDEGVQEFLEKETRPQQDDTSYGAEDMVKDPNEIDQFFLKALWLAVNCETVSISQLQRRFQIGYSRAGGLIDKMERMKFITGNEGSKARRVLLTKEEFEAKFGPPPEVL